MSRCRAALVVLLALAPLARAQKSPSPSPSPAAPAPTPSPTIPTPKLPTAPAAARNPKIERIQFRGNRKVEDDAIRINLVSHAGAELDPGKVREDVRALWKMGFFDD